MKRRWIRCSLVLLLCTPTFGEYSSNIQIAVGGSGTGGVAGVSDTYNLVSVHLPSTLERNYNQTGQPESYIPQLPFSGTAYSTLSVDAYANTGVLRFNVISGSSGSSQSTSPFDHDRIGSGLGLTRLYVAWDDNIRVVSRKLGPGVDLTVHYAMHVDGQINVEASDDPNSNLHMAEAGFDAEIGATSDSGGSREFAYGYASTGQQTVIRGPGSGTRSHFALTVKNNVPHLLTVGALSFGSTTTLVTGGTIDSNGTPSPPTTMTSLLAASFSDTVSWDGIEYVTDPDGNRVDDWTVTSDSGFDYSQPAITPEPAVGLLMLPWVLLAHWRARLH